MRILVSGRDCGGHYTKRTLQLQLLLVLLLPSPLLHVSGQGWAGAW